MTEARITINGVELTGGQSMAVRMAVTSTRAELEDPEEREALGEIAQAYIARLDELQRLLLAQ